MKKNYTIAICDILGFSSLVKISALDLLVNDHLGWLRKSLYHSIHKNDFPSEIPGLCDLQMQTNIGIFWFSDTILLFTIDDTDECIKISQQLWAGYYSRQILMVIFTCVVGFLMAKLLSILKIQSLLANL